MRRLRLLTLPVFVLALASFTTACADKSADAGADSGSSGEGDWGTQGSTGDGDGEGDGDGDGDGDSGGFSPKYDLGGGGTEGGDEGQMPPDDTGGEMDMGEPVCDEESPVTLYLSPDDSNSMSSPAQVRAAVLDGLGKIWSAPIRPWEFFNYYDWDYPSAEPGSLELAVEMFKPEDVGEGDFVMQISVTSEILTNQERPPMNITLVLDESGSMSGLPMELEKESARALAASLRAGDKVSMVTWDTQNAVLLGGYAVTGPNDATLLAKIEGLEAGGGTDLHGGLVAGYQLAQQTYDESRINRIVLMSDGGANVGITDEELIGMHAQDSDAEGIYMVGVGVGESNYNDLLMDTVTDLGKGASVFIPDADEAWEVFGEDFVNTMSVAARDVQVRIDLPPGFKFITFSGEEMSEDPEEIEPQHLAPNDSMVFHQTISSCAPELLDDASDFTVTVTYKDVLTFEEHQVQGTYKFSELVATQSPQLHKGRAMLAYTDALKAHKDGDGAAEVALALALIDEAENYIQDDPDLEEIRAVLDAL